MSGKHPRQLVSRGVLLPRPLDTDYLSIRVILPQVFGVSHCLSYGCRRELSHRINPRSGVGTFTDLSADSGHYYSAHPCVSHVVVTEMVDPCPGAVA